MNKISYLFQSSRLALESVQITSVCLIDDKKLSEFCISLGSTYVLEH